MLRFKLTLVVLIAALTTACANEQGTLAETSVQGWRRAKILAIGKDQLTVPERKEDCRTALGADAGYARFAVVSYSWGGDPNLRAQRIVAIPNDVDFSVNEWAFVNLLDCKLALRKVGLRNERP